MESELRGQVVMVTGAGRGIGQVVATRLAASGAHVIALARSAEQVSATAALIEAVGGQALAVSMDVTDQDSVQETVALVEERFGTIDLLVNNAGRGAVGGNFWDTDIVDWWRTVETNLYGVALCTWAVLPGMIRHQRGRIINIASNAAIRTNPFGSDYAASKAAVLRFTDSVAAEARPHGVHIFAISPGLVQTAMTSRQPHVKPATSDRNLGAQRMRTVGPWIPPERAADLCLQIASGRVDALSGHFIHVGDDLDDLLLHAGQIRERGQYLLRLPKLDGLAS